MEIEAWIKQKKELYTAVLSFLESENDFEDEFQTLTQIIDDQEIVKKEKSIKEIFQLLYRIGDNHYRTSEFFNRIGRIFKYLKKEEIPINDKEIVDIYKRNKRLLLLIFEHKIVTLNESILKYLMNNDEFNEPKSYYYYYYYYYSEIKNSIDDEKKKIIEKAINKYFKESIETFEKKIKEGSNDSLIYKLIRQDSIQEFVSYVNRTNISLLSKIKADFYESNSFLISNETSLIEYAFFYGSIQVIKYLLNNHVTFTPKIWLYAIHSNNPEMIEILEENQIKMNKESLIESIECHHNEITNYITDNLIDKSQYNEILDHINRSIIKYNNYYYYPDDINDIISKPSNKFKIGYLESSFTNITIPSSITSIGYCAFSKYSPLTQILIPSSVTSIGKYAFYECSSLTQILFKIPSSVTSIEDYSFCGCSSLKQISIPSSVTSIGYNTFSKCSSLIQVTFEMPSSLTSICSYAFFDCSLLNKIAIPSTVTSIGDYIFCKCLSLTRISIPSSVNYIGNGIFSECSSLERISFETPSSITSIGDFSFCGCSQLIKIAIPSSVIEIGYNAFENCPLLAQILIPSSVTNINSAITNFQKYKADQKL